jgi:hypothetical protein
MTENSQERLQKSGDDFHMMLGYCIAQWATVDEELFLIFRHCLGPYEQSAIIYFRTPGLNVRLNLTDEIVLSVLPEKERISGGHDHPSVTAWKAAIADFPALLAVRRRIAHHPVAPRHMVLGGALLGEMGLNNAMLGSTGTRESWFEIYESRHEKMRGKSGGRSPLTFEDLQDHLTRVHALGDGLHAFLHEVLIPQAKAGLVPKSDVPCSTACAEQ